MVKIARVSSADNYQSLHERITGFIAGVRDFEYKEGNLRRPLLLSPYQTWTTPS